MLARMPLPVPSPRSARSSRPPCVTSTTARSGRRSTTAGRDDRTVLSRWTGSCRRARPDFAVYYHEGFDPEAIKELGWPGQLSDLGSRGRIFNGGSKLTVDERL